MRTGAPVLIDDVLTHPLTAPIADLLSSRRVRGIAVFPVQWRGRSLGAILLRKRNPGVQHVGAARPRARQADREHHRRAPAPRRRAREPARPDAPDLARPLRGRAPAARHRLAQGALRGRRRRRGRPRRRRPDPVRQPRRRADHRLRARRPARQRARRSRPARPARPDRRRDRARARRRQRRHVRPPALDDLAARRCGSRPRPRRCSPAPAP